MPASAQVFLRAVVAVAAAAGAFTFAAAPASAADAGTPAERFEQGRAAYESNHWALAFERFAALADEGHVDAARMASDMARYGPVLYGQRFASGPQRQQRWNALVQHAGRRSAEAQALRLSTLEVRP